MNHCSFVHPDHNISGTISYICSCVRVSVLEVPVVLTIHCEILSDALEGYKRE